VTVIKLFVIQIPSKAMPALSMRGHIPSRVGSTCDLGKLSAGRFAYQTGTRCHGFVLGREAVANLK
jgi:hypothetical protein